jgi:putative ABC transport system permease protein
MGNFKLAVFLAYKSIIKGNRWTLTLIITVMSLSFANLILTPSILSGVTEALNREEINTLYGNILIDPDSDKTYLDHISTIEKILEQEPEVRSVASHLSCNAFFEYNWNRRLSLQDTSQTGNWSIIGIDPEKESQITTINQSIYEGRYLLPEDRDSIVLGVEIAGGEKATNVESRTLGGVNAGDKVRITYANGVQKQYTVQGIFKALAMGANSQAFITRKEIVSVMGPGVFNDRANQILIRTQPGTTEGPVLTNLKALGINGQIRSWRDYGGTMGNVVSSFDVVASLISGIGLGVAGIVMFIVIYINVIHRRRQIGILRAIGLNRNVVLGSYLIQSMLFVILGILIGGLLFGYAIMPYFKSHPIDLPVGLVSLVINPDTVRDSIIGLLLAAILAGVVPVVSITRQSIIKAIWGN